MLQIRNALLVNTSAVLSLGTLVLPSFVFAILWGIGSGQLNVVLVQVVARTTVICRLLFAPVDSNRHVRTFNLSIQRSRTAQDE